MCRRLTIVLALLLYCLTGSAQYDVSFSHYWDLETYYNPAAVGKQEKINAAAVYALDFAGFEHNPRSMFITGDMPFYALNSYHGVGVNLLNDQIGLFTHQRTAVQYSFKKNLFKGVLSVGVQAGLLMEDFKGSEVDVVDEGDPVFTTADVTGNALDLAFGLYYSHKNWYVGLSGQHLNAPLVELGETNELQIDRTYYLTGGYNIKLRNPLLTIPTSFLVRTDGVAYRGDITARLVYTNEKRKMYGGLSYSPTNSVTVLIGGVFHDFNVGYSYEFYTSSLNMGYGSHELFVGYQMDINLYKKGRNKHKSVRIL